MKKPTTNGRVKIDKGVAIPLNSAAGRKPKYPWAEMKIGDSFLSEAKGPNALTHVRSCAQNKTGFRFITRTTPEGVRVWRVS